MITRNPIVFHNIRKIGEILTSQKAQEMIAAWQSQEPEAIRSFLYGRHVFDKILQAPQCEGIRVFNAINDKGDHALVFIGADAKGNHIFQYSIQTIEGMIVIDDPILDGGSPCPSYCPFGSSDLEGYIWNKTNETPLDLTKIGESISREKAHEWISTWQNEEPEAVRSWLYGREIFEAILNVPGCAGIRVFNGINNKGQHALVFAGVDTKGGNILQYKMKTAEGMKIVNAPLADGGLEYPTYCPENMDLGDYIWNS